jgi:hypothetical protein
MSMYRGPDYVGDPFLHPSRRQAFSPVVTSRASVPIFRSETASDLLVAVHEAAHCTYMFVHRRGVHSVEIDGRGGGQFKSHSGPDLPLLTGRTLPPVSVTTDVATKRDWISLLTGLSVALHAQRKYGAAPADDSLCSHDYASIHRVLDGITASRPENRALLDAIEERAECFVNEHWGSIMRLARVLARRGKLSKREIEAVLRGSSIALNSNAVTFAHGLISAGKVNWGPFAASPGDPDGGELLDEEGEDAAEYYALGIDTEVVGTGQYHYPFGKNGEVYIEALLEAQKEGGLVADYATKLLTEITEQQKQSYQPKKPPPNRPRGYPDADKLYWRHDGYLRPFS